MSSKSHPNPSLGLRKSHDGKAARNQGPNRTKGPKGCAHVQGEARDADLMAPNGRSKSLGLDGRYARALARTRAPKTLAALLAAGGLVLAVPLLPQPAMACGTVKLTVAFTRMPRAVSSSTTAMPTAVAGTLIAILGASEASCVACATIRS